MSDHIFDPITELAAAAVQHHEMYEAWLGAGFTPTEALELLKAVILGLAGGGTA